MVPPQNTPATLADAAHATAQDGQNSADLLVFRINPRLLKLLGEQLIRDANVAVFELVKNAYDADATRCIVSIRHPADKSQATIEIRDNGSGMDVDILKNVWMVIGTDFRAKQRDDDRRTPLFHRYPLGEKGLGRLSVHKLGNKINLVTRVQGGEELSLELDWDRLGSSSDLNTAVVRLEHHDASVFQGEEHGTFLQVGPPLPESWSRGELRRLYRAVNSLCSPYKGPTDFEVKFDVPDQQDWLSGLFTAEDVNACALYYVKGSFEGRKARFEYTFTPPTQLRGQLVGRDANVEDITLAWKRGTQTDEPLDLSKYQVGKVEFEFRLFDGDTRVLQSITDDVKGLREYLDENGGIRIYREGIRVYDFGEPGNDWLNLDLRRVNIPTARTSNNQILGILSLEGTASTDLREKSNREGFIENRAFEAFRAAVLSVLTQIEAEKGKDQSRVRAVLGKSTGQRVFTRLSDLRAALADKGVLPQVEAELKKVETEMEIYQNQLLHAAVPGLSMGMMLHGAEKILEELREAVRTEAGSRKGRELVDRLYRAMRPITNLLKNPGLATTSASNLIKEAMFSTELRLKRHKIKRIVDSELGCPDFKVECSKQMLVAAITNLIDNSIHWLRIKNPLEKKIYIGLSTEIEGGPAIVVADNGPGFQADSPDDLITPFFTRRNDSMGLGLYIVSEVMRVNKGNIIFPAHGDVDLPDGLDGAVVALQFSSPI